MVKKDLRTLGDLSKEELRAEVEKLQKQINARQEERRQEKRIESRVSTLVVETGETEAVITAEIPEDMELEVEVIKETDAELMRRVRFHIKVNEFRSNAKKIEEAEANKHWLLKAKDKASKSINKTIDKIIEKLGEC